MEGATEADQGRCRVETRNDLLMSAVKSTFPGVANAGAFGLGHVFASAPVTSAEALRNSDELRNALLERLGDVAWIQSKAICAHHDGRSDADGDGADVVIYRRVRVELAGDGSHRDWHPTNRLGEDFWVRLAIAWIGSMERSMSREGAAFGFQCQAMRAGPLCGSGALTECSA